MNKKFLNSSGWKKLLIPDEKFISSRSKNFLTAQKSRIKSNIFELPENHMKKMENWTGEIPMRYNNIFLFLFYNNKVRNKAAISEQCL